LGKNSSTKSSLYSFPSSSFIFFRHCFGSSMSSHAPHLLPCCSSGRQTSATCFHVSWYLPHPSQVGSTLSSTVARCAGCLSGPVVDSAYRFHFTILPIAVPLTCLSSCLNLFLPCFNLPSVTCGFLGSTTSVASFCQAVCLLISI